MSYSELKQVEQNWSSLTKTANHLYHQEDYQSAVNYYQQALFYSKLMLRNADNAIKLNEYFKFFGYVLYFKKKRKWLIKNRFKQK